MKLKLSKYSLLILFILTNNIYSKIDPLSQISITSNKALCQKEKENSSFFTFTYLEDVIVTFSDQSQIKSDSLNIKIDTKNLKSLKNTKSKNQKQSVEGNNYSFIKQIDFKDNVFVKRENREIKANIAHIYPEKKICKLIGNVQIKQDKQKIKDLPIITNCNEAKIDMNTDKIIFKGNKNNPVNTIIKIAGHPSFFKKIKTKEEKKAERLAARRARRLAKKQSKKK